jgi:excisionase family DNA binding protein
MNLSEEHKVYEPLWTKKDVANYLAISVRKVEMLMKNRSIPYHKIDGSVRFVPAKVRKFVEDKYQYQKQIVRRIVSAPKNPTGNKCKTNKFIPTYEKVKIYREPDHKGLKRV